MAKKNFLIEGVSTTGKTAVCHELRRRGYDAINGDRELTYSGDRATGKSIPVHSHDTHLWDELKVREISSDSTGEVTFFCGGSRNFSRFIDVFDKVFVLEIDEATLERRLAGRPSDEFGSEPAEQELIRRLHRSKEDVPQPGVVIDATAPLKEVVDRILFESGVAQSEDSNHATSPPLM